MSSLLGTDTLNTLAPSWNLSSMDIVVSCSKPTAHITLLYYISREYFRQKLGLCFYCVFTRNSPELCLVPKCYSHSDNAKQIWIFIPCTICSIITKKCHHWETYMRGTFVSTFDIKLTWCRKTHSYFEHAMGWGPRLH